MKQKIYKKNILYNKSKNVTAKTKMNWQKQKLNKCKLKDTIIKQTITENIVQQQNNNKKKHNRLKNVSAKAKIR